MITTKLDISLRGKSTAVRLPVVIAEAFRAKADRLALQYGRAAEAAQREHNGSLAEAITKWVGEVPLYATREAWVGAAVEMMRPVFKAKGLALPNTIRATIAFTSKGWNKGKVKRRGECWHPEHSTDGATEIMIDLCETDPATIVNILTHELGHAAQQIIAVARSLRENDPVKSAKLLKLAGGHGTIWKEVASILDLEAPLVPNKKGEPKPKWECALGGEAWKAWAQPIIDALGVCPHKALAEFVAKSKEESKQTTRMLKLEHEACAASDDGSPVVWRMSSKHIADRAQVVCPCCGKKVDNPHYEDGGEDEGEEEASSREHHQNDADADPDDFVKARARRDAERDKEHMRKIGKSVGRSVKEAVSARQGKRSVVQELLDNATGKGRK